ncbi:hypothetical protein LDL48_39585 [Wangella sp. NEAU-J3]|nr:hypothetical protein [Jidongwangia harbinensis]
MRHHAINRLLVTGPARRLLGIVTPPTYSRSTTVPTRRSVPMYGRHSRHCRQAMSPSTYTTASRSSPGPSRPPGSSLCPRGSSTACPV